MTSALPLEQELEKYHHINHNILNYLSAEGRKDLKVLDVGCWDGSFGRALKQKFPECIVHGLDFEETALAKAKEVYDQIGLVNLNLPDLSPLENWPEQYDFIVCGDVLEHLIDSDQVLTLLKNKLKKGGKIAISLPNVGFFLYRLMLFFGEWRYSKLGVMDQTHLRFFTLRSMKRFIASQRLKVLRYDSLNEMRGIFFLIKLLGKVWPSLFAAQVTFLLTPEQNP